MKLTYKPTKKRLEEVYPKLADGRSHAPIPASVRSRYQKVIICNFSKIVGRWICPLQKYISRGRSYELQAAIFFDVRVTT